MFSLKLIEKMMGLNETHSKRFPEHIKSVLILQSTNFTSLICHGLKIIRYWARYSWHLLFIRL